MVSYQHLLLLSSSVVPAEGLICIKIIRDDRPLINLFSTISSCYTTIQALHYRLVGPLINLSSVVYVCTDERFNGNWTELLNILNHFHLERRMVSNKYLLVLLSSIVPAQGHICKKNVEDGEALIDFFSMISMCFRNACILFSGHYTMSFLPYMNTSTS
jgi:hypothetical protein